MGTEVRVESHGQLCPPSIYFHRPGDREVILVSYLILILLITIY